MDWRSGTTMIVLAMQLLASAAAFPADKTQPSPTIINFGIVPQQSATEIAKLWTPILKYLSVKTGYQIELQTAKDISVFEERLAAGEYDIAYMNPYHYTVFHRAPGYQVFAKEKDKQLVGIIVVRADSDYQSLADLKGQTLAFPSPIALAASVLPRAYLRNQGIPFTPKYVSSHDSVYLSVIQGLYPAGGGIMRTFNTLSPERATRLRVLWKSPGYTPHAIAAHPRLPKKTVKRIQQAMLSMDRDPQALALLKEIDFKGIVSAVDADYDDIRALGLVLLNDLVKGN